LLINILHMILPHRFVYAHLDADQIEIANRSAFSFINSSSLNEDENEENSYGELSNFLCLI